MTALDRNVRSLSVETILSSEVRASSVIAAVAVAPNGQVLAANECLLKLLGRRAEECVGGNVTRLLADQGEWRAWLPAANGSSDVYPTDIRLKTADGRIVPVRGDIRRVEPGKGRIWLTGLFVDASAAKHFETSMHHASRMEAVASLTSGIAHDFSNLLTVLVGNLYLVSEGVRDRPELYEKTKITRDAAKRGIELIRQLLSFSRNESVPEDSTDTRKTIRGLEPLLRRAMGSRITLTTDIAPDIARIAASSAHLESAIVNLVMNARDAIEERGTIRITVRKLSLSSPRAASYAVDPGDYVEIAVQDTGVGIPDSLMGRVFEPFFSTKGQGKGTGLGLAMVRLFATHAGGTVLLSSAVGQGTTVTLLLPTARDDTSASQTTTTTPLHTLPCGSETILLYADDAELRGTVEQMLNVLGYKVVFGSDPRAELSRVRSGEIDLILADGKSLPASPAFSLLRALSKRAYRPPTVILQDTISVHYADVVTLQKPFDLAGLASTVRQALDGRGT